MVTRATGIVLAGGESSRMGQPKSQLRFGDRALLDLVISRLREVMEHVIVVAAPGQQVAAPGATLVHDDIAHQGPLNGMRHGLAAARSDVCFVASCDLPFLNRSLITHLVDASPGYDVVVPRWRQRLQPLHAVYRRGVLSMVEGLLATGERRPAALFERVRTRTIEEGEIRRFDTDGWSFFNINTPGDYGEAIERWHRGTVCTVELFGAAWFFGKTREITLRLPPGATVSDVFAALEERLPHLTKRIVSADGQTLNDGYACSLNGLQFVRSGRTPVAPDDHLLILSADVGG